MPAPLGKLVDVAMALTKFADAAGLERDEARRVLHVLALLPTDEGDALLAEARREVIRELSAEFRRRRSR